MTTSMYVEAAAQVRPAGPAPLDQVLLATGAVTVMTLALGLLLLAHRSGRITFLDRLVERAETSRALSSAAGWATVPLLCAMVSLITALIGMYWDIALHIGVGRDEGPLANPAHYPIMFGLFGLSASGALACALPRGHAAGPAAVRVSREWSMPVGGLLLTAAGSYALLGFPLDDVWHRIFGQDVTLWGPTHLMLIGGAGLSLVGMAILYQEGARAIRATAPHRPVQSYVLRVGIMGGLLIGLSVFQAEYDFGVPQFRLVLQPLLIATAAALSLVAARMWIGRGGAVAAVGFYALVRGGVSLLVGPVLGEVPASVPLYLCEAICVELVALLLLRRSLAFGAVSGVLVGTVGFASEYAWTHLAYVLPWSPDVVVEGMSLAIVGGLSGGLLGALLALGLQRRLPRRAVSGALFALATVAIAAGMVDGLRTTTPDGLRATLELHTTQSPAGTTAPQHVEGEIHFSRPPVTGEPAWLTLTGWQGAGARGLYVDHLQRISPTTYRITEPAPVGGSWKTMVRLHDAHDLSAMAVFLPADTAIDEPEVPAADGATRVFDDEHLLLQRERKAGVPGWLWLVAGLVVLACSAILVAALGWGVSRYARAADERADGAQDRVRWRDAARPSRSGGRTVKASSS